MKNMKKCLTARRDIEFYSRQRQACVVTRCSFHETKAKRPKKHSENMQQRPKHGTRSVHLGSYDSIHAPGG